MKRSEKIIIGILTLGLIAALCIGGTMAYMTDWEDKENTFTVGTLDVALEEKNWDAGEGGDSERLALIRSMIRFDSTYDADAQKNGTVVVPGESYSLADIAALPMINPAFTEVATGKAGEYCYTYNSVLAEGENVALFTNVVVPTDWSQIQLDAAGAFKIDVTVEAIQAKNFENAAAAFSALDSEISAGTIVHNYDSTN